MRFLTALLACLMLLLVAGTSHATVFARRAVVVRQPLVLADAVSDPCASQAPLFGAAAIDVQSAAVVQQQLFAAQVVQPVVVRRAAVVGVRRVGAVRVVRPAVRLRVGARRLRFR